MAVMSQPTHFQISCLCGGRSNLHTCPFPPLAWRSPSMAGVLTIRSLGNVDSGGSRLESQHREPLVEKMVQRHQRRTAGRTAQKAARAWQKAAIEKRLFDD